MKINLFSTLLILLTALSCTPTENENMPTEEEKSTAVTSAFDAIPKSQIMVLGSYHFAQEDHYYELSEANQKEIAKLVNKLAEFKPTKVVIEKEPRLDSVYNALYQKYLVDEQLIDTLPNETYQLGFRLAKKMGHEKIYLFDDKTEFIGSLENFSFEALDEEIAKNEVFVKQHVEVMTKSYAENESTRQSLNLYDAMVSHNSPQHQEWNTQRMHAYEIRAGIQDSWMGPDWLGRWYQRNIRMTSNLLRFNNPGKDRMLIIVGDNHKWTLETLFHSTPDFEVVSSYDLLK